MTLSGVRWRQAGVAVPSRYEWGEAGSVRAEEHVRSEEHVRGERTVRGEDEMASSPSLMAIWKSRLKPSIVSTDPKLEMLSLRLRAERQGVMVRRAGRGEVVDGP